MESAVLAQLTEHIRSMLTRPFRVLSGLIWVRKDLLGFGIVLLDLTCIDLISDIEIPKKSALLSSASNY